MAFLNNSGDIILDAVLTDLGRERLANGTFSITKFALGDDEIDYSLFNTGETTAISDLQILQTPVLEAFTNNASSMKSKLLTIPLKNLEFLPVLKINNLVNGKEFSEKFVSNGYVVSSTAATEIALNGTGLVQYIRGASVRGKKILRVDQGIDNPAVTSLNIELKETQYIIEFDSRFASLVGGDGITTKTPTYIDDDYIASYFLTQTSDSESIVDNPTLFTATNISQQQEVVNGPRGTILQFSLQISSQLETSDYLFDALGTVDSTTIPGTTFKKIITNIIVTGATTGNSVAIPVVFIKSV